MSKEINILNKFIGSTLKNAANKLGVISGFKSMIGYDNNLYMNCSHSLLSKDYNYIYNALNRNIGEVEYNQKISNFSFDVGYAYTNNFPSETVYNFVGDVRKKFSNYYDYAQQNLNQNLHISNLYDGILNGEGELILSSDNEKNNVFDNSTTIGESKLTEQSVEYKKLLDFILNNKERKEFVFGRGADGEKIPHQITIGYSFNNLPNNIGKGFSIEHGDVIELEIKTDFGNYSFDEKNFGLFGRTTYFMSPSQDTIRKNLHEVSKSNYSYIFQNTDKKPRYIGNYNEPVGYDEISRGFNQNLNSKIIYSYAESQYDNNPGGSDTDSTNEEVSKFGEFYQKSYSAENLFSNTKDLISFTNNNFKNGRYKTLIARFGSQAEGAALSEDFVSDYSVYNTAISERGMSHGRNLLRRKGSRDVKYQGYTDPYCRVWTNFHQYNDVKDLIRPFSEIDDNGNVKEITHEDLYDKYGFHNVRTSSSLDFENGQVRLGENSVLQNGFVNIAPMYSDDKGQMEKHSTVKQCMFSLENLAWKGCTEELSREQKGPLGGRIMWFPPYDLKFSESVSVPWNSTQFIGRGEKIYTYTDTERSGQLSFKMLIDHPSIIHYFPETVDDNDFNQNGTEYDLLRFFAGCGFPDGMTEAPKNTDDKKVKNQGVANREDDADIAANEPNNNEVDNLNNNDANISDIVPTTEKIIFMAFYPNNYSGAYEKNEVDPITYLLNGIGAQKQYVDGKIVDIPTNDAILSYGNGKLVGYEVGSKNNEKGISCILSSDTKINGEIHEIDIDGLSLAPYKNPKHDAKYDWWYRVDTRKKSDAKSPDSEWLPVGPNRTSVGHKDISCHGLNRDVNSFRNFISNYEIKEDDVENLYSLTEIFSALKEINGIQNVLTKEFKKQNSGKVEEIIAKLKDPKVKITSITTKGYASKHGYSKSNAYLMNDRANTLKKWVSNLLKSKITEETDVRFIKSEPSIDEKNTAVEYGGKKDESEIYAKLGRCAKCVIEYTKEVVENLQDTTTSNYVGKSADTFVKKNDKTSTNPKMFTKNEVKTTDTKAHEKSGYDNEYQFFKKIQLNDTFLHHKIREKIQYFDPAFHSISPEGFNSRLTFLHQCTRQGPTVGNSNINETKTANNLAFGRQPVCVLRIGDFYYTKIIIESLNIDYEQQWDLNQEGIGVQPMIANINLSFKFIGGSDIAGPIARLQNAVSFNFYANAGVYDSRSEMIGYDDTGKPNKYKPFNAGITEFPKL